MPTALFISPHLDDVAFSCGGTLLRLADEGWNVILCTIFTASVAHPEGFALRCQTDKGIAPAVDYMELRRAEDVAYAALSNVTDLRHWSFREAPHRGYDSPAELFAGAHETDRIWQPVRDALTALDVEVQPDAVYAPQGLGNHVDHLQTIRAVLGVYPVARVCWYRDTPYAFRDPGAKPAASLPTEKLRLVSDSLPPERLERKIAGCCCYASQLGFQFGGPEGVRETLTAFHRAEARAGSLPTDYAENYLTDPRLHLSVSP